MPREIGICEVCGWKDWLELHHKDRNKKNNAPSNLQRICKMCHGKEHGLEGIDNRGIGEYDCLDYINRSHKYYDSKDL